MGINDSTRYRVTPFASAIELEKKIDSFLHLFVSKVSLLNVDDDAYRYKCSHDKKEYPLKPCVRYLSSLVSSRPQIGKVKSPHSIEMRKRIKDGNAETIKLAEQIINGNSTNKDDRWAYYEGTSYPDIFLHRGNCVVVAEGKWTEHSLTKRTSHDRNRDQMVRHIDGALQKFPDACIIPLFIFDIDSSKRLFEEATLLNREAIKDALKHHGEAEVSLLMKRIILDDKGCVFIKTFQGIVKDLNLSVTFLEKQSTKRMKINE